MLPNDETEQDRLDLYHHIFALLLGGHLYSVPLDNPRRILDVGTGTGSWAMDIAEEFPNAQVIGNDLSPIQPKWYVSVAALFEFHALYNFKKWTDMFWEIIIRILPNVTFEVEDAEDPWTYSRNSFDYIHMRSMSGAFENWDAVLRQVFL